VASPAVAPPAETVAAGTPAAEAPVAKAESEAAAPVEAAITPAEAPSRLNGAARSSLQEVLTAAGMELIETKSAPAPVVDIEPVRLGRARKPVSRVAEEPLQQVETH
jgi:ribonuclease E